MTYKVIKQVFVNFQIFFKFYWYINVYIQLQNKNKQLKNLINYISIDTLYKLTNLHLYSLILF